MHADWMEIYRIWAHLFKKNLNSKQRFAKYETKMWFERRTCSYVIYQRVTNITMKRHPGRGKKPVITNEYSG